MATALCPAHARQHASWSNIDPATYRALVDGGGIHITQIGNPSPARVAEDLAARRARARTLQTDQLASIVASCGAGRGCTPKET